MKKILGSLGFALFLSLVASAHAAPLNLTTAEQVSLASPLTTFTIATGSVADVLTITSSSVLATLSNSTGGSFTLLSPSYDLSVATSSNGGTATISCSSGVESVVISQTTGSTVYTITTGGTTCSSGAPPVISNIGTSGVTTSTATVSWTTNTLATTTIEYGTTPSYGSTVNDANLTTGDSVTLSGLSQNTTYHFAIIAYANGTSTTSGDNTFTTSAGISVGSGGGSTSSGGGGSAYDLAVNGGAAETDTISVTLSLYGTAAYTMEVSNTSTFAGAAWIPYVTTMPWTLASNLGTETVYAQFRAVNGTIAGNAQASIDLVSAGSLPAASSSQSSTSLSPSDELKALQSRLAVLLSRANQTVPSSSSSGSAHFIFTRNLSFGMTGNDVKELQLFLISENTGTAARALAKHGVTRNFATLTLNALIEFQKKGNIKPSIGYFGPITRAYVAKL